MHLRTAVLLLFLFPLAAASSHAQIYVDVDATGANDGTSWTDAYTDLQNALNEATGGDEIWIAEGVYNPTDGTDQTVSFEITGAQDGLEVYGGFDGSETSRSERIPKQHVTVLSGDIDDNDVTDSDGVTEDADDISGTNSRHVLLLDGTSGGVITTSTVIDGVTITAGQSGDEDNTKEPRTDAGGGLFCDGSGSGNECSPLIRGVVFAGNAADGGSGAQQNNGAGLYNFGERGGTSSPTVRDAVFRGNEAGVSGAGKGGAIYNDGGYGTSSPSVTNVVFEGNAARDGGAIYNYGFQGTSSPQLTNATFISNSTRRRGGAIYNDGFEGTSNPVITNAVFTGNTASIFGGAIYNDGREGTSEPQITNTILWGNSAPNEGDEIYNSFATPTLSHTIIEGGVNGSGVEGDSNTDDGGGNLDQDPQFVDASNPAGPDGTVGTEDDGLRITASSPALDRGTSASFQAGGVAEDVTTDLTGTDRRFGLRPDLGPYEFSTLASESDDIDDASGLTGFLEPSGFGGQLLIRDNPATSGGLTFERVEETPSGNGLPSGMAPFRWTVTSGLDAEPTYDLVLETEEVPGIEDFSTLMIYTSEDGGQTWDPVDTEGTVVRQADRGLLAVEGLTGFSQFAIGSESDPLPVELTSFESTTTENGVHLTWKTASETGNAGFGIQRRVGEGTEGREGAWTELAFVEGGGSTSEAQTYRFIDADLPYDADSLRYRLKQVDTDGTTHLSDPIAVVRGGAEQVELLGTAPNPASRRATVRFAIPDGTEGDVMMRLYDMMGRQVRAVQTAAEVGRHERALDVGDLASGIYILQLRTDGKIETQKMTVVQ